MPNTALPLTDCVFPASLTTGLAGIASAPFEQ